MSSFCPEFDKEIEWGNKILDELQKIFKHIVYLEGNHEARLDNVRKVVPISYRGYFRLEEKLHLSKRMIPFIRYNNWLDIGINFFSITHGMYHGATAHKRHYLACPNNIFFSHIHSCHEVPLQTRGVTKRATSTPCLCDMNPDYMREIETNWDNGFSTLTVTSDQNIYSTNNLIIRDGKLVLIDGRIIDGNKL